MSGNDLNATIDDLYRRVWPDGDPDIRAYLVPIVARFAQSDCCDSHYYDELLSGDLNKIAARGWEAMLYSRFQDLGWQTSSKDAGPDFTINDNVYIEAVTAQPGDPESGGLPQEWQSGTLDASCVIPIEQMLLRWTSVIKAKNDAYLRYLDKGLLQGDLPFVIAINACRLGGDTHGVGGVPLAAMAVLPFGDPESTVEVRMGETLEGWHLTWRDGVSKNNGAPVPTDSFLRDEYRYVSAIIGCSGFYSMPDEREKFRGQPPYYVIHNPLAKHPLPVPWLPEAIEYTVDRPTDSSLVLRQCTTTDA